MGYSVYFSEKNQRWQGYGVSAYCDHPDCKNEIDRGMAYVCCGNQDHTNSCGGFYCSEHEGLCNIISEDELEDLEEEEVQELLCDYGLEEVPLFDEDGLYYHCQHKPIEVKEHPDWIKHVSTDASWKDWREKEPDLFMKMKESVK